MRKDPDQKRSSQVRIRSFSATRWATVNTILEGAPHTTLSSSIVCRPEACCQRRGIGGPPIAGKVVEGLKELVGRPGPRRGFGPTCILDDECRGRNVHTKAPSQLSMVTLKGRITLAPPDCAIGGPTSAHLPHKKELLWQGTVAGSQTKGVYPPLSRFFR